MASLYYLLSCGQNMRTSGREAIIVFLVRPTPGLMTPGFSATPSNTPKKKIDTFPEIRAWLPVLRSS
jgi:hypothetical protein